MSPPSDKSILDRAQNAWNAVKKMAPKPTKIQTGILDRWWSWAKDATEEVSKALGGDPPRQDFDQFTLPVWHTWPAVQPDANISAARAAALNAVSSALADANAYGGAAALALDRYGGASEARNLIWAAEQANARLYYEQQMGAALLTYAEGLDAFVQVLIDEGETDIQITVSDVITYQQRLATQGFTAQEIADAHLIGLSDAEIEEFRQGVIAADPATLAGSVLDIYTNEAAISRELGNALLQSYSFSPGLSVSGSAGLGPSVVISNTLAQIDNAVSTLQVGNPLTQTAVIDLHPRRIDLPADWTVSVSPEQVTLGPGEEATVTVSVLTGSLVPQGSLPRVAVEGYAGSQLLGGVVVEIVVPNYVFFDGNMRLYLPLLKK
jgi:hypothetical protein